jgi:hypothetical protein
MSDKILKNYPGEIPISDEERYVRLQRASTLLIAEAEALSRTAMRILNRMERTSDKEKFGA